LEGRRLRGPQGSRGELFKLRDELQKIVRDGEDQMGDAIHVANPSGGGERSTE
jgi:hypothetical protein